MPPAVRQIVLFVVLSALYFVVGKFGLHFGFLHPMASAVWPPTGLAIAALLIFGYRIWPAIFAGAFLINATSLLSIPTAAGIALGNTLEGLTAAFLINRIANGQAVFERATDILKFAAIAMYSTIISATIGVIALLLGDNITLEYAAPVWLTWWLGDVTGAMIVTPLLLLWWNDHSWKRSPRQLVEALVLLAVIVLITGTVFFQATVTRYPLAFLCLPPLAWAAFRFGQREVATGIAVLMLLATWATVTGNGPFVMMDANDSLLVLQAFIGTITVTTLPLAALVMERGKLLERESAALAAAEAANRGKDQFIAMLSHELRNPLNAVSMAVFIMQQSNKMDAETAHWADAIQRQTEHLTRIIDDLLDVTRVTTGKMTLARQPVDLSETVARCLRALSTTGHLEQRKLEVHAESVWVYGDPTRLEQIVTNLVNNSIKYTPADGIIRVSAGVEDGQARIQVEDNGIGIAPDLLPRVFDLFIQGEQGLDRSHGGLGVGLALVRRLAQLHGGDAQAQSAGVGLGSTFIVRLPRIETPAVVPAQHSRPIERTNSQRHVLVVEDNADSRRALRTVLEIAGHEVSELEDGRTAVEVARRLQPDVALVDIGLPHIDGYEVARRLKKDNAALRLVAVTGYGNQQDRQRAREAGFDAHMVKPVDPERLADVIDKVCDASSLPDTAGANAGL